MRGAFGKTCAFCARSFGRSKKFAGVGGERSVASDEVNCTLRVVCNCSLCKREGVCREGEGGSLRDCTPLGAAGDGKDRGGQGGSCIPHRSSTRRSALTAARTSSGLIEQAEGGEFAVAEMSGTAEGNAEGVGGTTGAGERGGPRGGGRGGGGMEIWGEVRGVLQTDALQRGERGVGAGVGVGAEAVRQTVRSSGAKEEVGAGGVVGDVGRAGKGKRCSSCMLQRMPKSASDIGFFGRCG